MVFILIFATHFSFVSKFIVEKDVERVFEVACPPIDRIFDFTLCSGFIFQSTISFSMFECAQKPPKLQLIDTVDPSTNALLPLISHSNHNRT